METRGPPPVQTEEVRGGNTRADARINDEHGDAITSEYARADRRNAADKPKATLSLKTHHGYGYLLPSLPWDETKLRIEEIYRLQGDENHLEAIKNGNFTIMTESYDTVLPAVWELVADQLGTAQVHLPLEVLDPEFAKQTRTRRTPSIHSVPRSIEGATRPQRYAPESVPEDSEGDGDDNNEESDIEYTSSEYTEDAWYTGVSPRPDRAVIIPVDGDGKSLSFHVSTALIEPLKLASSNNDLNKHEPRLSAGATDSMDVAKAVLTETESRSTLQLHVLPGPRNSPRHVDVSVRWHHLHSEKLDFNGFKEMCLAIPGLSDPLKKLTQKLFERLEKDKLKAFLGGMFIEPGAVLRADEKDQSDPQSVIFSCVPYFDLQKPAKSTLTASHSDRLFPSRTLMQSYYPYEPVKERDAEQAYRVHGSERSGALIHVPNLWILNIGAETVATCGHQALARELVQSLEVVQARRERSKDDQDHAINIRLIDWAGRRLLYSMEECRSYFQMEQKLRELPGRAGSGDRLQLEWHTLGGNVKVNPGMWPHILQEKVALFIDVSLPGSAQAKARSPTVEIPDPPSISLSPFFHWPQKTETNEMTTEGLIPADIKRSIQCLEHVEKAMLSEVLSEYGVYDAVEKTFTSTAYYRGLPESGLDQVESSIELLAWPDTTPLSRETGNTVHQVLLSRQRNKIAQGTTEMCKLMQKTFALFVADVDKSTMLRKSWGAMKSLCDVAVKICQSEMPSPDQDNPDISQGWFVRPDGIDADVSAPLTELKKTFKRCRKCRANEAYSTRQIAVSHLQKHLKGVDASELQTLAVGEWVIDSAQMTMETWNSGYATILTKSCQIAQELYVLARELSEGVCNEDGQMSDLYSFPRALLSAFRQLLVFYFAVERAMYFAERSYKHEMSRSDEPRLVEGLPFSPARLKVIETFGNGVKQAMGLARNQLCCMVKSSEPVDVFRRLSMSSEYVCSWFMRRLIVKPLEKSMTVSDMYREYLSTIQFQVNHRPGKRLLRSINLLQEELTALREINIQQSTLISDYKKVLDDATYETDISNRRAMFPYERMLLDSCQDSLQMMDQEYCYLIARCGPLSDTTKQSLEINEEDHGKAILVFTVVTIIFLPLSFVTSFLGMNTTDIRDMGSSSSLFWIIAVPLTVVTMGSILYISYNGDELRDTFGSLYHTVTGKQDRRRGARGISVAQRRRARKSVTGSNSSVDYKSLADEAEFANPRPEEYCSNQWRGAPRRPRRQHTLELPTMRWEPYASAQEDPADRQYRKNWRPIPGPESYEAPYSRIEPRQARRPDHELRPESPYDSDPRNEHITNDPAFDNAMRVERPFAQTSLPPPPLHDHRTFSDPDWNAELPRKRRVVPRIERTREPPHYDWTKERHRRHARTGRRGMGRMDEDDLNTEHRDRSRMRQR